ncbi:NUDIX hydrolase [Streptomyces sp. NBC_00525]|uniref:NUDIX hydrolase n=1 Tax=Streptomyces sp. NBC_00525 TaxID=2903660 RepID=UPI002E820947|nr:NUDIX hydrolase [Streptomyces sp. NBC_00525]WUC92207.1 NUDIX hydrolase [Streptomyces sp. NBC_00525]
MVSDTSAMNSRNTVCVIVHDKDRDLVAAVLYGTRDWSPQPVWTLPGGKADPGEPLDEAAARELKEETGLLVDPADLSLVHVVHVEQGGDRAGQFVLFAFATDTWTGELTLPATGVCGGAGLFDAPNPIGAAAAAPPPALRPASQ